MSNPSPLTGLVRLCHRRWTIRLVVAIGSSGARFAVLTRRLGVARQTLKRALDGAIAGGLAARNPGYGHPLRPEYVLTPTGLHLLAACRSVVQEAESVAPDLVGRKWTLPLLAAVEGGCHRFTDALNALEAVTPRALARAYDDLVDAGLLERDLSSRRPRYAVSSAARRLARRALELAERSSNPSVR